MTQKQSYFLVSLSNKENLKLCEEYALAGFPNSINGLWTFFEIREHDFISFLYAARAHNLYEVVKKESIENAENIGPWKPMTSKLSGKKYCFPFRLWLKPIREFNESLVRNEFCYIAENLLLRGGYRKTHFQADQTTLQNVSQMGGVYKKKIEELRATYSTFKPMFTTKKDRVIPQKVILFREVILQSLIRQYLSITENMKTFLGLLNVDELKAEDMEVLGEKALPEGHIDLLIKEAVPIGISRNIVIEVKLNKATEKDFEQVTHYIDEFGEECLKGVIIAKDFGKNISNKFPNIIPIKYSLTNFISEPKSFDDLLKILVLERT